MKQGDSFFIGWDSGSAPASVRRAKAFGWVAVLVGLLLAAVVAGLQQTPGAGTFAFGQIEEYEGVLLAEPVPLLVSASPEGGHQLFYLVAPLKNGFSAETATSFHLQQVRLQGTLIKDERNGMIEVVPESVQRVAGPGENPLPMRLGGAVTLQGEIVDSKCHLGVMNPGRFKPHRACAIQCLRGGIPPILVATATTGELRHYLLVGPDGEPIHDVVSEFAAEPVTVSGTLNRVGDLQVLQVNLDSLDRL